ncbi:MAG: universal stress protein [Desulforhopalus sp.]
MSDSFKPKDSEIKASMHDFEAALTAKRADLPVLQPLQKILVVLDGLNQSAMVLGLAAELASRHGSALLVGYVYVGPDDSEREQFLTQQIEILAQQGLNATRVARIHSSEPAYAQILTLAETLKADLMIVPAPYAEDFAELGSDSIGVTLDKLMTQARPLLVVREPREVPANSLKPVLLPLSMHVQENPNAAAWALRIIGPSGTVQMVAVVDDEVLDAAADIVGEHEAAELDLDRLAGLDRPVTAGLIAQMHRHCQQRSLGCGVSVRRGDLVAQVIELAKEGQRLIVTGCDTDPTSRSFRNVQAIIRCARDPVLVI